MRCGMLESVFVETSFSCYHVLPILELFVHALLAYGTASERRHDTQRSLDEISHQDCCLPIHCSVCRSWEIGHLDNSAAQAS